MKKRLLTVAAVAAMSTMMSMTAFAGMGSWQQNETGWWWQRNDGSYPAGEWKWVDGDGDGTAESYYFDGNGYLATNTTTPDGYTVNADGAWVQDGVVQKRQVMLDLGDEVLAAQTATQTNTTGNPVMDGKSIEQIVVNPELFGMFESLQDSLNNFPDKQVIAEGVWGPTYTATYRGAPITIESYTKLNSINTFTGTAAQIFDGIPANGIEMNAFYDNTGYESYSTKRKVMASTGRSDEIFGLPGGSYRMAWGNIGIHHFEILLTAGNDDKWYIYPDSKVFMN